MPQFEQYLRAAYPIVWVNTLEPHRAERDLAQVAKAVHQDTEPHRWDAVGGLRPVGASEAQPSAPPKAVAQAAGMERAVTFLHNFHRFMGSVEVIQALQNAVPVLKGSGSCLVVLAPDADKLPPELARMTVVWDFPLPGREHLAETASRLSQDANLEPLEDRTPLVEAALGLTEGEAEDAMALSVVEARVLTPAVVAREKAGALLRQANISLEHYPDRFEDLGGLDNLKRFTLATAPSERSLGIFLLGVPGAGKSTFARCLGNELGIPALSLDFGRMMGSLVGQSEAASFVVPVARSMKEAIEEMRTWAKGRCLPASTPMPAPARDGRRILTT